MRSDAAAPAASSDDEDAAVDEAGEQSNKGKGRFRRKGVSPEELVAEYRSCLYFTQQKSLTDSVKKAVDRVVESLNLLAHKDTFCSHEVQKDSRRVNIRQHHAQYIVVYQSPDGTTRTFVSPGWQQHEEVSTQLEGLVQAIKEAYTDADAGGAIVEACLFKIAQRLPPMLGLQAFGRAIGHWALKMAVYNIKGFRLAEGQGSKGRGSGSGNNGRGSA
ncbi:hypothetical protein OEZ86_005080 [Tetradesmus obliquus]|nr:hypothetical protein OEZ86_005080 [Tetradesmus obliquus]